MGNSLRVEVDQCRHGLQHVVSHGALTVTLLFAHKAEKLRPSHSEKQCCQYLCANFSHPTYFSMTIASLPGPAEKRPNAFGRLGWPKRVSMRTSARVAASVCFSRHTTLAAASRPVFRSRHAITTARDPRSSSSRIS